MSTVDVDSREHRSPSIDGLFDWVYDGGRSYSNCRTRIGCDDEDNETMDRTSGEWSASLGECCSPRTRRCLGTYRLQGSREILPPEAVVYLAAQVVAERATCLHESLTADALSDHGGRELAVLFELDREGFEDLIEAGRRFFFPGR
jgi:hypothetical protein